MQHLISFMLDEFAPIRPANSYSKAKFRIAGLLDLVARRQEPILI